MARRDDREPITADWLISEYGFVEKKSGLGRELFSREPVQFSVIYRVPSILIFGRSVPVQPETRGDFRKLAAFMFDSRLDDQSF